MNAYISRIAPTPSGYLHLGNALSFILTWLLVRKNRGILHLRIDDLDGARKRDAYIEEVFRTLDWLQLDYDHGPSGPEEFARKYSQQHRMERYTSLLSQLQESGQLFACTCSRKTIQAISPAGHYPGTCREKHLPFDTPLAAWRIRTPEESLIRWNDQISGKQEWDLDETMRDFVVLRKELTPAYQIASLADDIDMGVNLVVRGRDLLPSTAAQLFLSQALGSPEFEQTQWYHHPLLSQTDGTKLSKSHKAPALKSFREGNGEPQFVIQQAAKWLGLPDQSIETLQDVLDQFRELPAEFGVVSGESGT